MAKTFAEWAATEIHDPNKKISNLEKLTADFLIGDYKTWGDVYKAADIEPPKPPKAKPKVKKADKASDLNKSITMVEDLLSKKEREVLRFEPGSEEYVKITDAIKKDKEALKQLKTRFDAATAAESDTKKEETFQSEENTYESKLELARKKVQIAKDTDGDVAAAQAELDRVTATQPFTPVVGTENVAMAGQPSGYRNVGTQKTGTTPTPAAGTPTTPKVGTPPKGGTGDGTPKVPALTDAEQRAQALETADENFELPETIFNNVPSLKTILDRYVKENWTESKLRKAIRDDVWYRKNSKEIKERYVQLYNYRDMVATGQADGSTDYEKQISTLERQIADKARAMGSGIASDPAALRKAAENMYITNVGIDDAMTTDFIAAAIRPIGSTIGGQGTTGYSGQALKDYQAIQDVARSNGFSVKDIVPGGQSEQQVLQGIATGKIDPNRLAQDARKLAAQGQPQYVRDLLGQGYNLDQVFAPYRQTMANLLEINADQIDLNDPTLRTAITDQGDMNVYDFKRTLKADKRWQYTENAKSEVSDAALKVLRDFGFQG
jgi:tetratricopeptide (TPR) repeat protein